MMTQADRDRLVTLKKANSGAITQKQAAQELKLSERQVRRLLKKLRRGKDKAVVHGLRGRPSNRKISDQERTKAIQILRQDVYRGFGPTLASEYLAKKHRILVSDETVRQWMATEGLWQIRPRKITEIHQWRRRRERSGELVQWDTSEHNWLEGRGEKLYLIAMIDDATSRLWARFARHDSTEENMRVLRSYLERRGRPLEFYTDKASLFVTTAKKNHPPRTEEMPPTQIGRALRELQIGWIAAHSPQAQGRIERGFHTLQDRLVKGMRVARVKTLEQANAYLERELLPEWESKFTVPAACADDAHRPLGPSHDLDAILCRVEQRVVANDYTLRFDNRIYQIARADIEAGMRGQPVRIEQRAHGEVRVRFGDRYRQVSECPSAAATPSSKPRPPRSRPGSNARRKSQWMRNFFDQPGPSLGKAIKISNATSRSKFRTRCAGQARRSSL